MPWTVFAGELPERFSLCRTVPPDMWFVIHEVYTPDREKVWNHWNNFFAALMESGIEQDIKALVTSDCTEAERLDLDVKWQGIRDTLMQVPWVEIGSKEFVFAERLVPMIPDYVLLSRNADEARARAIAESLKQLWGTLATTWPALEALETTQHGVPVHTLRLADGLFRVDLFQRGDVVGVCIGNSATEQVLARLTGQVQAASVVDTPKFKKALAAVNTPGDSFTYLDLEMLFVQIKGFFVEMLKHAEEGDEDVRFFRGLVFKALDQFDVMDYVMMSNRMDGLRDLGTEVCALRADAKNKPFARAITERRPFEQFDRYVPADATGFSVTTFIDLQMVYNLASDFIAQEIPNDGPAMLQTWAQLQEGVGFNLNRDVLDWLSGEMISIDLPGLPGQSNAVLMVRTRNGALASAKLGELFDRIAAHLPEGSLTITAAADVEADGFRSVFHPMMMMAMVRPVIGVHDEWLVIGTTASSVNKCLATAKGVSPSFRDNERFRREGIAINGPVTSASFTDLSHVGQEIGAVLAGVGMASGMIPEGDETRPVRAIFRMLGRLAPVMGKLDFLGSTASATVFSEDRWISQSVTVYKEPAPPATASTDNMK